MQTIKNVSKFVIPLFIMLFGIAFVFVFEFYIKDQINTINVIVAKENIPFKGIIHEDNIEIASIKRDQLVQDAYYGVQPEHLEKLYGRVAAVEIKAGTQIYEDLLDTYDLVPNEEIGEFIAPIPNEWIFAVPGSLRRSYFADFYIVPEEKREEINFALSKMNDEEFQEDQPIQMQNNVLAQHSVMLNNPILTNVRVAHTKDTSNREVRNLDDDTTDASGNISHIEIVANQEILNTIRNYMAKGNKLYITYTFRGSKGDDHS